MPRAFLAGVLALSLALPMAAAGVPVPGTPVGEFCVNVNTDTCSTSGFTAAMPYNFGFIGAFMGTFQLITDAPGFHHTSTCTGILAGAFVLDPDTIVGECVHVGTLPPPGVPITLTCLSEGTGVVACSVTQY
jgi:hypothetical protein